VSVALPAIPAGRYGLKQVVRSETAKILTLRSTAITLGFTVVASLLVTGLVSNAAVGRDPGFYIGFDPTQQSLSGMIVAALTGGVFGALLITGEYASGTIRTTLSATPRRSVLLAGKVGVTAVTVVVFSEVLSFVGFLLGQAILSGQKAPSLSSALQGGSGPVGPGGKSLLTRIVTHADLGTPGALRAVLLTGLFIALFALMSFGFGMIFRSTAAAIAAFVGVVFVLPLVMRGISEHAVRYLPTNMLVDSIMSTQKAGGSYPPLSPAVASLLMVVYAAMAVAVGWGVFVRRDA
jgi:ABC-type transport system involved in multi-copper enzyme maturation permease subunit